MIVSAFQRCVMCRSSSVHKIWDDFRQRWLFGCWSVPCLPPNFGRKSEKNNCPLHLISDGQQRTRPHSPGRWVCHLLQSSPGSGDGKSWRVSRSFSEHDFQVSSPSQLEDPWTPLMNVTFESCSLGCSIYPVLKYMSLSWFPGFQPISIRGPLEPLMNVTFLSCSLGCSIYQWGGPVWFPTPTHLNWRIIPCLCWM